MLRREKLLAEQNEKLLKENLRLRSTCESIFKSAQSEPNNVTMWALPLSMFTKQDQTSCPTPAGKFETPQLVNSFPPGRWHNNGAANAEQVFAKQAGNATKIRGLRNSKVTKCADNVSAPECNTHPDDRTTIMLRNLPNNYSSTMLLDLLDSEGFKGHYDFVYLPIDFVTEASLAYAFVNLTTHEVAEKLRIAFQGFSQWIVPTKKRCIVSWSAPCQGLEDHIERYRNSPVMHDSVPLHFQPALFKNGVRVPFPPPSKKVRPPRVRSCRTSP
jgi:hypothetical protein